jgi:uncharacterized protein (DUF305 family)
MKNIILVSVVTVVISYIVLSCNSKSSVTSETDVSKPLMSHSDSVSAGMLPPIGHVMTQMNDIKMTGDFDLDFATTMIVHHQTAIDMSKSQLIQGANERIKSMAQDIINEQNVEIDQLQLFIKNYKVKEITKAETDALLSTMMKEMADKMGSIIMTGSSDSDFVKLMIPHHESAVKMAEAELVYGKEVTLRKMAQQMITDQNGEIGEFKTWLLNQ